MAISGRQGRDTSDEAVQLIGSFLTGRASAVHRRLGDVLGVAVTVSVRGEPLTIGSSSDLALKVDQTQYRIGEGACLTALRRGEATYVPDLASDPRWPVYGPAAARLGARSCISVPVISGDRSVGAAKVYAGEVDGLTSSQQALAREFATEVSGALALAGTLAERDQELADRAAAMDTRRTIDLALGMLMERTGCTPDDAFALLKSYSQRENVKVRAIAERLVAGPDPSSPSTGSPFRRRGTQPER